MLFLIITKVHTKVFSGLETQMPRFSRQFWILDITQPYRPPCPATAFSFAFIVRNVSFISMLCFVERIVCICVLCLIVITLPPGTTNFNV
jgi:hypothetical protein